MRPLGGGGGGGATTEAARNRFNLPPDATSPLHAGKGSTSCIKSSFRLSTDREGSRDASSAAAPATWGAAMLVPDSTAYPLPLVLRMSTPGAARSTEVAP